MYLSVDFLDRQVAQTGCLKKFCPDKSGKAIISSKDNRAVEVNSNMRSIGAKEVHI